MTRASKSPRLNALINQSAVTFLILCIWAGPRRTIFWLSVIAIALVWRRLAQRWPILNVMLVGFIRGLLGR